MTCGGGQCARTRKVAVLAANGGLPCEAADSMEVQGCGMEPCERDAVDCLWDTWNEWTTCTATCGGGEKGRKRAVVQEASGGGVPCTGPMNEFRSCNEDPCGMPDSLDCEWGQWARK